jgi:DNA-directed RNA polymerase subunit M/transcription elongation factor TFIIS
MTDAARIAEAEEEARERRLNPRGVRLAVHPLGARNIGQDYQNAPGATEAPLPRALPQDRCPACHSDEVDYPRMAARYGRPECDYHRCRECGNEWGHV